MSKHTSGWLEPLLSPAYPSNFKRNWQIISACGSKPVMRDSVRYCVLKIEKQDFESLRCAG